MNKKVFSVLLAFIIILSTFPVGVYAGTVSISAEEFNDSLYEMIKEYNDAQVTPSSNYLIPPNRLIVKTNSNDPITENYGAIDSVEGYKGIHIFQYSSVYKTNIAYENFLEDEIEYVEYDFYFKLSDPTSTDSIENISTGFSTWNSEVAQVEDAYNLIEEYGLTCSKVKVGIIDSGVYPQHDAFTQNGDRIFDTKYALEDDETGEIYSSMEDEVNHGSHVTGIIYNNTMSNVELYPYRVFALMDTTSYVYIYSAFEKAVSQGMDIINMSLGGTYSENNQNCITLNNAITDATNAGVVVVVAAGNYCGNSDEICPANCPAAITVAATEENNLPDITYSASGYCVDIAAPGTRISSTVPRYYTKIESALDKNKPYDPIPKSLYMEMSGTSMATPLVAAAAAMIKSIDPDISPAEVKRLIKETAYVPDDWEESCGENNYGTGIVNFYNIAKAMLDPEYSATPTISVNSDNKFEITVPDGVDAKIFYTLDGTIPTLENHLTYTEPLNLRAKNLTLVKAACYENGKLISEPAVYDLITYNEKSVFYKWSSTLTTDADTSNAKWHSNNPNIASVDSNGNIKGVSKGNTRITCSLPSGERIIWRVNVKYSPLQAFFVMFFFGFLWI